MDWEPSYCSLLAGSTSLLWSINRDNRESTLGWCDQLFVQALSHRLKLVMRMDCQSRVSIKIHIGRGSWRKSYHKVLHFHVCTPETR